MARVSRLRVKKTKPISSIIGSYAVVLVVLLAFIAGLFVLVALELLIFN